MAKKLIDGHIRQEDEYLVFAAEQYRFAKGLSGAEVAELFAKYGVSKFIIDAFELLHIEDESNMIAAAREFIERQKANGGNAPGLGPAHNTLTCGFGIVV